MRVIHHADSVMRIVSWDWKAQIAMGLHRVGWRREHSIVCVLVPIVVRMSLCAVHCFVAFHCADASLSAVLLENYADRAHNLLKYEVIH